MPPELVTTKLRPPRAHLNPVSRPRLREALAGNDGRALTLVSAPAGFGKTTLLVEWLAGLPDESSVAWISLDESDNDPTRFLSYLVGALREAVASGIGEGVTVALSSPERLSTETLAGVLVNELAETPREVTVVLDDYHRIRCDEVHEIVAFMLEHPPENLRLVIATRADPPLPLPRLRARGMVSELRAADLRFTPPEATVFLGEVMGLSLSDREVATLGEATEGWIVALQLAALSMRDREDVSGFVETFSGSNRHVLDFLAEEVLERQSEEIREFLLRTSVLDRMTALSCEALTDESASQEMLERLERENLFVVALDDERRWYRYHHLFRDFLKSRLRDEIPELARKLRVRASVWHEEAGFVPESIGYALSAPDYERAARLIEVEVKHSWSRGEGPTVLRWLESLPAATKRERPRLLLQHAQARVLTGRLERVETLLAEAERAALSAGEDRDFLLGFASAVRSWRAGLQGDGSGAADFARTALSKLPERESHLRNFAAFSLGDALRTTGEMTAAREALESAVEIGRAGDHVYGTLSAMGLHAQVKMEEGRLRESKEAFERALDFVRELGFEQLPGAGTIYIGLANLLYEWDETEEAEHEVEKGVELAERTREVGDLVWGYVTRSRIKQARGDAEEALATARKAERVAHGSGADLPLSVAGAWTTRLHLAQGNVAEALAHHEERADDRDATGDVRISTQTLSARLMNALGRHDEALRLLEEPPKTAKTGGRVGRLVEILALRALTLWKANRRERAVNTLIEALSLSEPEGYVRTFVDEGAGMGELLSETLEVHRSGRLDIDSEEVSTRYLAKLLAACARDATTSSPRTDGLDEPLSEREMEILVLIAAGRSNAEISGNLFVSISTVKTHINNLYRKLDAHSRTQAIARAREMDLV